MKLFLGSTTEEVELAASDWLAKKNICVGNYIESTLYKLGDVYQLVLVYAELWMPT